MSIATAIQNAQTRVANAYTAVSGKGGTLPDTQNLTNLPTAINSINTSYNIPVGGIIKTFSNNKHAYFFKEIVGDTVVIAGLSDGGSYGTSVDVYKTLNGVSTLLQTIPMTDLSQGNTVTITITGGYDGLYLD